MKARALAATTLVSVLFCGLAVEVRAQANDCAATVFVLQDLEQGRAVTSPDGHYRAVLHVRSEGDTGDLQVLKGDQIRATFTLKDLSAGIFLNWAPDSQAFYLMWSNGGAIGGYEVRAFRIVNDRVADLPLAKPAEADFAKRHPCAARGSNTFAVRWTEGSQELLLALQMYPTGDCGQEAGLYAGYLVRGTDGRILRRYSEAQLKAVWPVGCPSQIYPTGLWTSEDLQRARKRSGSPPATPAGP